MFKTWVTVIWIASLHGLSNTNYLFAQPGQVRFEHFTQEDGLSAPVTRIIQDHIGFLWLGTTDGINRFDGKNFVVYRNIPGDTNSLPNNIINDLSVDNAGRVWIATIGGLCYYDFSVNHLKTISFQDTLEKIDRHRVHAVFCAENGETWFATKTILHHIQPGGSIRSYSLPRLRNVTIKYLYQQNHDKVWVGTNDSLFLINPRTEKCLETEIASAFSKSRNLSTTIHPILPYKNDTLLIGSWYGGVHKAFTHENEINTISLQDKVEVDPKKHVVRSMCKGMDENYWVGTYGNGISVLHPATGTFHQHYHHNPADPSSLSSDFVFEVFMDASGILWIGTNEGLDKYDPLAQQFKSISIPMASSEFSVYRLPGHIMEDHDFPNLLWITIAGVGIMQYNRNTDTFIAFNENNSDPYSLPDNRVYIIHRDSKGRHWVGMRSGMCHMNPRTGKFSPIKFPGDSIPLAVHKIVEDKQQNFWFATQSHGVYYFEEKRNRITSYRYDESDPNSLPDNRIFCMMEDHEGNIWVGTQNRGMCRIEVSTGKITRFEHKKLDRQSIPDNGVYEFMETPDNYMWIATENGLAKMNLSDFSIQHYTTQDGLCNNDVFSILPDKQGHYWFATNNGLSRYHTVDNTFKSYFMRDGLPMNKIDGAMLCTRDGTI